MGIQHISNVWRYVSVRDFIGKGAEIISYSKLTQSTEARFGKVILPLEISLIH